MNNRTEIAQQQNTDIANWIVPKSHQFADALRGMVDIIADMDETRKLGAGLHSKKLKKGGYVHTIRTEGFELGIRTKKADNSDEQLVDIVHFGRDTDQVDIAVHFDRQGNPALDAYGHFLVEGFDKKTALPSAVPLNDEFLMQKQSDLDLFLKLLSKDKNKESSGSRRWFLMRAFPVVAGLAAACTPHTQRARNLGEKYAREGGTPTPGSEWVTGHELLKNSTVIIGKMDNINAAGRVILGSAGLIDGAAKQRPDLIFVVTNRHVVLTDSGQNKFENSALALENYVLPVYENLENGKFALAVDKQYDVAVIAIRKSDIKNQRLIQGILSQVDEGWDGTGQVLVSGYNSYFSEGVGDIIPQISVRDPMNRLSNTGAYLYQGEGGVPGASGGPGINRDNKAVGVHQGRNDIFTDVTSIAPLRNFSRLADEAISKLK